MIFEKFGEFFKHNPEKLDLIDIDPSQVQADTLRGNLRNLPEAERLASRVNAFNSDELLKTMEKMLPGYGALRDQVTGSLASMARGEIPKDVENQLLRRAAERGITLGTAGSKFQSYDTLRNLGLTSLDILQRGVAGAASWVQAAPRAPQFDVSSMFFTPQQRLQYEFSQAQANLPIRQFNNWVDSLSEPWERFLIQGFEDLGSMADLAAGFAAGGGFGVMGGGDEPPPPPPPPGGGGGFGGWGGGNLPGGVGGYVNSSGGGAPGGGSFAGFYGMRY